MALRYYDDMSVIVTPIMNEINKFVKSGKPVAMVETTDVNKSYNSYRTALSRLGINKQVYCRRFNGNLYLVAANKELSDLERRIFRIPHYPNSVK